jgi:hypothetical protein
LEGLLERIQTFLRLRDTPSSYSGEGGKVVRIKSTEDGIEFTTGAPPELHAGTHTDGTDDIQNSGPAQKGLMTSSQYADLLKAILNDGTRAMAETLDMDGNAIKDALIPRLFFVSDALGSDAAGVDGGYNNPYKSLQHAIDSQASSSYYIAIIADDATYGTVVLNSAEKVVIIGRGEISITSATVSGASKLILIDVNCLGNVITGDSGTLETYRGSISGTLNTSVSYKFVATEVANIGAATWTGFYCKTGKFYFSALDVGGQPLTSMGDPIAVTDGLNLQTLTAKAGDVSARVYRSSTLSVSDNSWDLVNFDSESYDTDAMHSNTVNPSQVKVSTGEGGKYDIIADVEFAGHVDGIRGLALFKNAAEVKRILANPIGAQVTRLQLLDSIALVPTDYIQIKVYQTSGSALNANGGEYGTSLSLTKRRQD